MFFFTYHTEPEAAAQIKTIQTKEEAVSQTQSGAAVAVI